MKRLLTLSATALLVAAFGVPVLGTTADTCKEIGFADNVEADASGPWGSIGFDDTSSTLDLTVEEGWEVRICVKAGSAQQGNGPEDLGWFGEGEYALSHSSGKELSHYGYEVREVPVTTTTTEGTTTTTGETTTTTIVETTTTEQETTTTVPEETTTTTQPETTTVPDQSGSDEEPVPPSQRRAELPFTGPETEALLAIGSALGALGGLTLFAARGRKRG